MGLKRVGERELRTLQGALRERGGSNLSASPAYLAQVLRDAGTPVDFDGRYGSPAIDEPYASRLEGLLAFRDLESTEESLRKLDAVYRQYRAVSDRVGTSWVRSLVVKGRHRAEGLSGSPRVRAEKRREKKEVALWFRIWLENADLFFDWLELRKKSDEFRQLFGYHDGQPSRNSAA